MENNVVIILARGGSKEIPKKNIVKFCGKPLLAWSIEQALNAKKISSVWVSSDSQEILKIAKKYGAETITRPKSISSDVSSSESGWQHAVKKIEKNDKKIDVVIALQATSPLRESHDLDNALIKFKRTNADSMFSCSELKDFFLWTRKNKSYSSSNYNYKNRKRRQDLKEQILENGSFYIFKPKNLLKFNNRLSGKIEVAVLEFWKSFEIDSIDSLWLCEVLMKNYLLKERK